MSLITSCPACGTMFRVVPDQLKISEGWVRCGHCAEVFDATAHMAEEPVFAAAPAPRDDTRPMELPTRPVELQTRPAALMPQPPAPPPSPRQPSPPAPRQPPPEPAPPPSALPRERPADSLPPPEPDSVLEASALDEPFVFRRSDLIEPDPMPSVMPGLAPLPPAGDSRQPDEDEEEQDERAAAERVSFVRQARRRALWHRPAVRLLLVLVSLALAALLVLQVAYHDRDRLALAQPALRPALARMCQELGCTLQAPRQIEALAIESSGFNRLRNDTYRLTFALRNAARVPVAVPAIELTLTDGQDQPLVRRVLTPAELGSPDGALAPGAEWTGNVGLVLADGDPAQVAGYRLLAFYP